MNFASVFKTPTVFFCVNNQWAISTPVSQADGDARRSPRRPPRTAMPGVRVDGFDPIACWKVTRDALDRAAPGEGPTLIEAYCYRLHAARHRRRSTSLPRRVRDRAVDASRAGRSHGRRSCERLGVLDDGLEESIRAEAKQTIADAVTEMESMEQPGQEILFDDVYASRPALDVRRRPRGTAALVARARGQATRPPARAVHRRRRGSEDLR